MATHVTQRDGSGTQKQHTAVNTMVAEFASIRQDADKESITEYLRRYERAQKTLLNAGFDANKEWLDTEEKKVIKFLYSLDQAKFGRLIRDIANNVVPIPESIQSLIKIAKDRKEVAAPNHRRSVLATTVNTDDYTIDPQKTAMLSKTKRVTTREPETRRER